MLVPLYILKKINHYIHSNNQLIINPIIINKTFIVIKTNKGIKTIDKQSILSDNIDDILDISTIEHLDQLI